MTYKRRLPIYLLLDCSESMVGEAFTAMKRGLDTMIGELRADSIASNLVGLSIITFAGSARQITPLTKLAKINVPKLRLGSGTAMGAALDLLEKSISQEVKKTSSKHKGDCKPIVFILTDGEPTDNWEKAASRIRNKITDKSANVIGVGCGPDADIEMLRKITETVIAMRDMDEVSFSKFFKWVSQSVLTASQGLEASSGQGVILPNPPKDYLEIISAAKQPAGHKTHRHIFLHVRCSKKTAFYLARFTRERTVQDSSGGDKCIYKGTASYPLDDNDFEKDPVKKGLPVQIESLTAPPPCPYCNNPRLVLCGCGRMQCAPVPEKVIDLTCPWCKKTRTYGTPQRVKAEPREQETKQQEIPPETGQLVAHSVPGAGTFLRPSECSLPFLHPVIGFDKEWYWKQTGVKFDNRWYTDPAYRLEATLKMRGKLKEYFGNRSISGIDEPEDSIDLLSGTYSGCLVPAIYGMRLTCNAAGMMCPEKHLTTSELESLEPPDLDRNPVFLQLVRQMEWIANNRGQVKGVVEWQSVWNNAQRMGLSWYNDGWSCRPDLVRQLLECICTTMIEGMKRIHELQQISSVDIDYTLLKNCYGFDLEECGPAIYRDFVLPFDVRIARGLRRIGIHHCWKNAHDYVDLYAEIPNLCYVQVGYVGCARKGWGADLSHVWKVLPDVRHAVISKMTWRALDEPGWWYRRKLRKDLRRVAQSFGPCDVVLSELESSTSIEQVKDFYDVCIEVSEEFSNSPGQ